jgi:hypothetical protein
MIDWPGRKEREDNGKNTKNCLTEFLPALPSHRLFTKILNIISFENSIGQLFMYYRLYFVRKRNTKNKELSAMAEIRHHFLVMSEKGLSIIKLSISEITSWKEEFE